MAESLQQLGLESWTARLLSWLGRFEGLERHLEEDCDPVLCVRQILRLISREAPENRKAWQM